jgi:hypothetical protein
MGFIALASPPELLSVVQWPSSAFRKVSGSRFDTTRSRLFISQSPWLCFRRPEALLKSESARLAKKKDDSALEPPQNLQQLRGERTAFAVVTRRIVFPQQTNGETLSPRGRFFFRGCKTRTCGESANIREVLLKFIFGPAFHVGLPSISL